MLAAGIFHYQRNSGCGTAQFQISFPEPNPGTLPATFMIATMPAALQQTFFGTTYTMEQVRGTGRHPWLMLWLNCFVDVSAGCLCRSLPGGCCMRCGLPGGGTVEVTGSMDALLAAFC